MNDFNKYFDKHFGESLKEKGFILKEESNPTIVYYSRYEKEVYQYIRIENYGNWRIELDICLNKQNGDSNDHRKFYYCYGPIERTSKFPENWFYYPDIKSYKEILEILYGRIEKLEISLLDQRLNDFIIRHKWNTEVIDNLEQNIAEYEKTNPFPQSMLELCEQFNNKILEAQDIKVDEWKDILIQLASVYMEYIKRNNTGEVKVIRHESSNFDSVMLKVSGSNQGKKMRVPSESITRHIIHPLVEVYTAWILKDAGDLSYNFFLAYLDSKKA